MLNSRELPVSHFHGYNSPIHYPMGKKIPLGCHNIVHSAMDITYFGICQIKIKFRQLPVYKKEYIKKGIILP